MEEKKKLVLIADDFKDTREMYRHFLSQHGLEVALASSGSAAFLKALQLLPDLILMDLSLPDISGGEVVARLKADQRTKHIQVFALTAYGPERMPGSAFLEAGFSGYLTKTAPLEEILHAILGALGIAMSQSSAAPPASANTDPDTHLAAAQTQERPLVLVADDYADDREMYAHFLNKKGFRVALASNGLEALRKIGHLLPDVVIMDLSLPIMGGWEVTAKLKSDDKTKHIPVVILTAHALEGASTVIESGCEGFLIKPCLPDDLVKEIVRVLGKQTQNSNAATDSFRATAPR